MNLKLKNSIINSLKSRTFIRNTILYIFMKMKFCTNYTRGLITMDRTFYKLQKKYKKKLDNMEIEKKETQKSNYIWICWLQGIEQAPLIVKRCFQSVQNWYPDKEIIVITEKNFSNYVDIPEYIIKKWKKNIINNAHFSDILRLALLVKNGGLWLDATVLCTGNSWEKFENEDLFVFQTGWRNKETINMGNWLIYAKTNNVILETTLNLLYDYWKKFNYACDYFIFHMFFKMVTDNLIDEWRKVPYLPHVNNHLLEMELLNKFDEKRYNMITNLTNFHKLTYKLNFEENNIKDTFYEKIIINRGKNNDIY